MQRVTGASVEVGGTDVASIGRGILIFLGVHRLDAGQEADWLARKCARLRIFPDEAGLMNRSVTDIQGQALVVSQFTLYGSAAKGNRPSFVDAAKPPKAEALYERFVQALEEEMRRPVATGVFGAAMKVHLTNDGPVTLWIERSRSG